MKNLSEHVKTSKVSRSRNKSQTLIREAYETIKQMIFEKKFVPGQRLVNRDFCKMLNMSPTPINNALNRLFHDDLVGYKDFIGFYVKPISVQETWDAFGVREALEVYAVEEAIKKGDSNDMALLEERLNQYEIYKPHVYTHQKFLLDMSIHFQIATITKNSVLKLRIKQIYEYLHMRSGMDNYDPARMEPAAKEHRLLIERMKEKDILQSVEIMRKHIQNARLEFIKSISSRPITPLQAGVGMKK